MSKIFGCRVDRRHDHRTKPFEPLSHIRALHGLDRRAVELIDHLRRRSLREEDTPPCRAAKNLDDGRDAPIDKKCNLDRRIVVVCCPELERVRPVIVRGSTARPAQVHQYDA